MDSKTMERPNPRHRGKFTTAQHAEAKSQFIAALQAYGLALQRAGLIADGKTHRCDVAGKGKSGRGDAIKFSCKVSLGGGAVVTPACREGEAQAARTLWR
jgi:phage/plasmid primase-like uncharacterized protein